MSVPPVASATVANADPSPACLAPRPVTDATALQVLDRRFGEFDIAAEGGEADGKVSRGDLQAVLANSDDQELVDAAAHLLGNDALHGALDVAGEGGGEDGVVSAKDLTSYIVREAPEAMPALGSTQVTGSADNPIVLQIDAQAPAGASWTNEEGTRAGIVSVYVDGEYVADATILAENPDGTVEVNLGVLGEGEHTIELRDSTAVGTGADAPGVRIDRLDTRELDIDSPLQSERDQALAAKYAPNLALADEAQATNNTPLMTTAQVIHHDDGSTTIAYRIVYSNEDGGHGSDPELLDNKWGRTTDDERIYEVTVDADGEVIDFSGKNSSGAELSDDDKGVRDMLAARDQGGLPGLSVYTDHNNVRWDEPGERHNRAYSGMPLLVDTGPNTGRDASNEPGAPTNAVMRDNPWLWAVTNAEMAREGKIGTGDGQVDPYRRLYLSVGEGTFSPDTAVEVTVRNDDGSTTVTTLALEDIGDSDTNSVSVALDFDPADIVSVEIVGSGGGQAQAYYLTGDDVPMDVATTTSD